MVLVLRVVPLRAVTQQVMILLLLLLFLLLFLLRAPQQSRFLVDSLLLWLSLLSRDGWVASIVLVVAPWKKKNTEWMIQLLEIRILLMMGEGNET